jgi:hypothetical protein
MITNKRLRDALENADWGKDNKEKSGHSRESGKGNGEGKARSERSQVSKDHNAGGWKTQREEKNAKQGDCGLFDRTQGRQMQQRAITREGTSSILGQGSVRRRQSVEEMKTRTIPIVGENAGNEEAFSRTKNTKERTRSMGNLENLRHNVDLDKTFTR